MNYVNVIVDAVLAICAISRHGTNIKEVRLSNIIYTTDVSTWETWASCNRT